MKISVIAAILAVCVVPTFAAEREQSADGTFQSGTVEMPVISAMAYPAKSIIDKRDVIMVAITNGAINVDWFATFFDRHRAIQARMKDSETAIVYLEFEPDGGYLGLSYFFASGNGCGYCSGGATSTVKVTNGRIAGTLKGTDESRIFDVVFDVPITSNAHGAPLPPDGGAPGKAYLGYHDALVKRDADALRPFISDALREYLDAAATKGRADAEMDDWAEEHPDNSVKITKGFSNGDHAVLLIDGSSSVVNLTGEVVLVNEEGSWRVDDELTDVVLK